MSHLDGDGSRRVLVLGAQGFLGAFLAHAFAGEGWRVVRAGRRAERADDFRLVDLDRPETVRDACGDVDLVVSTVRHPGLAAERAVLHAGPTLLNLDDLPAEPRTQLARETAAPRGLVVDRAGLYGIAMLVLTALVVRHPEADAVDYGFLACVAEAAGPAGGALIRRLLVGRGRHPTAVFALPPPFGRCRALEAGPDAADLVREVAGARAGRVFVSFRPPAVNRALLALNAVALASRLPRAVFTAGRSRRPPEPTRQPTCHWVRVRRGADVLGARFVRGDGDYRTSVAATLAFAGALVPYAGATPSRRGLFGIDEVVTLAEMEPVLRARGIETGGLPA